jgi:hypothetical protein
MKLWTLLVAATVVVASPAGGTPPQYQIYDIGVAQSGDSASEAFGVSTAAIVVGRSLRNGGSQAFSWTRGGGIVALPNLAGTNYCTATGAKNYDGIAVVGTCSTDASGTDRVPVVWENGTVARLPLPPGATVGEANSIGPRNIPVGSAGTGTLQRAAIYSRTSASFITQTTSIGSYFLTALGISEFNRVVGQGVDPNNQARNVGIAHDPSTGETLEVGVLPGMNGAIVYGIANYGQFLAGASMLDHGPPRPFVRSEYGALVAIPLVPGTDRGVARAVNSFGWTVGTDSSDFTVPFLYDATTTYRLADLIPSGSGWDLATNTSSSAVGITDGRVIVGTGIFNGQRRAFAMLPPQPPPSCTVCHKGYATLTYPCGSAEYARHRDHGDTQGPCRLQAAPEPATAR